MLALAEMAICYVCSMRITRRWHYVIEALGFILIMLSMRDWARTADFRALAPFRIYMGVLGGVLLVTSIFWTPRGRKEGREG